MKRTRVVILGGGMIGSTMAMDLAGREGWDVTVADVREETLAEVARRHGVGTARADLSDPAAVRSLAEAHDLVIGALPSVLGMKALGTVIDAGRNAVDISFMPEDPLGLGAEAEARGVTAVVDCGVAPGISHMMAGRAAACLAPCRRIEIYVGGLPGERRWPFDYKAGFAPHDVIEEYVRPARMVENGRVVVKEALSEVEPLDVPGIGTLEAFNTDGLRTLLHTLDVPFMKEKTLRYPGHVQLMRAFRETGFFSEAPVTIRGQQVRPRDLTAALLFPKWAFGEGEEDLTVLHVTADGEEAGGPMRYVWDLIDRYDAATRQRSMSRTTAFPATIVAGLVASGRFRRPGVHPPETLGAVPGLLESVLAELETRGVHCRSRVERLVPEDDAVLVR